MVEARTALAWTLAGLVAAALWCRMRDPVLWPYAPAADVSLGVSGKGVHAARLAGAARNDLLGSALLALVLAKLSRGPLTFWLVVVLVVAEALHIAYGVRTPTFKWLFGDGRADSSVAPSASAATPAFPSACASRVTREKPHR